MRPELVQRGLLFCGGLAFFLYGMRLLSERLRFLCGSAPERRLRRLTDSRGKAIALGAGLTVCVQSSSAVTVLLVGLADAGVLLPAQTLGLIIGSNLGTTLTPWLFSFGGAQQGGSWSGLLHPEQLALAAALIGVCLLLRKKEKPRTLGGCVFGLSLLLHAMTLMTRSTRGIETLPLYTAAMEKLQNPLSALLVGTAFTALVQSSAASVGVLQGLALTGGISWGTALALVLGQNIGTCGTALLSSLGGEKNAKRVAMLHLLFNVVGAAVCLPLAYGINALLPEPFLLTAVTPAGVALCNTLSNAVTALVFFPFLPRRSRRSLYPKFYKPDGAKHLDLQP